MEAICLIAKPGAQKISKKHRRELMLKAAGYNAACTKYRVEIEAIQQRMPNWKPELPTF